MLMQLLHQNNSINVIPIDEIIENYKTMVYSIALTHVKNKTDADDVFQQVFLIYQEKNQMFNEEEHRKAWLIRTTANCCKKVTGSTWRKKTKYLEDMAEIPCSFSSKEENEVYIAVCSLPDKYKLVIHLFYFESLSVEKISKALKISASNVRMRLTRGRNMLREKLTGDYFYE